MRPNLQLARNASRGLGGVLVLIIGMGIILGVTAKPVNFRTVRIVTGAHRDLITAASGATPHGLLTAQDDTVTWCRDEGGAFIVEFKDGSPFRDGRTKFTEKDCDKNPPVVKPAISMNDADVFKYTLTVPGVAPFDPHVIIVGSGGDSGTLQ